MGFNPHEEASRFLWPSPQERGAWPTLKFLLLAVLFTAIPGVVAYVMGALAGAGIATGLDVTHLPFMQAYRLIVSGSRLDADLGVVIQELPEVGLMMTWAGGVLLALTLAYQRPMHGWLSSAARFRWRALFWGVLLCGALWAAGIAVQGALSADGYRPDLDWLEGRPLHVALFLLTLPATVLIRAGVEEIIFRGWMMRQILAVVPSLLTALVSSAILFAVLHRELEAFRMTQLLAAGLAFGWAAIRTGGLEWGIGLHTGWNLAIDLLADRNTVQVSPGQDLAQALAQGGTITAPEWVVLIAMPILAIALTEVILRTPRLRAFVGLSSTAAAARLPSA